LIENPPAKPFGFGGKPPPLAIRKSKAATSELLSENTILLDKILDDMLLPLVHPTGNGNDEKRKWIQRRLHRRSVSRPEPIHAGLSAEPLRTQIEFPDITGPRRHLFAICVLLERFCRR
jgi:hypothetical protein